MKTFRQLFAVASLLLAVCLPARAAVVITNINLGSAANDGTGDTLRGALTKAMTNFHRLNYGKIESTNGAGTAGDVLTSDGSAWYAAAPTGGSGTSGIFTNVIYVNANGASQAANGALLTNAFESDLQGVRIIVGPGEYYVGEFAVPSPAFSQDNRIIEFQPGANIRAGSTSSAAFFMFDDSAAKRTNVWVTGRGNFFQTNAPGGSGALLSLESGSTVYFEHQNSYLTNADSTYTMGGVGNNTLTFLTHGRASTWTYDNAFFNGSMTNRLYAFQNEIETVGDILEVSGNAAAWGDVVFGYNKAWARDGLSGQASIMQIGGRVTVKNGVLTVERTNASIFSTSATTNGLIEGGMILMPPNGRRSVLEDNSQGTGVPFNGMTALWLKNIFIRGATNVDAFSLTNGTVNETILENVRLDAGWASTNAIRATTPSKVRIVGNLEVHPYRPFGSGITIVGTNATSAIRNIGTLVNHGAAFFSNSVSAVGNIASDGDLSGQNITASGDINGAYITASAAIGTAALNLGNPTPSSLLMVNGNGDATNVTLGSGLSLAGTTLSASASGGTNNPILFSGGTLTLIANQTSRHKHSTDASFAFALSGASNQSARVFAEFQNTSTNTIYATNATGFYDVALASNVTVIPIAGRSVLLMDAYLSVSNNWVANLSGAAYALEFSNGTKATNHTTKTVTYTAPSGGGSSSFNSTNITVSTTNEVVIDVAAFDIANLKLLTNLNTLTFSNASTMGKRGAVYLRQDTNGTRTISNWKVAGGVLQMPTNHTTTITTNANAADLLEVMPGAENTNIWAWWPQDFHPRIGFTNSIASGLHTASSALFDGANDKITFSGSAITFTEGKNLTVAVAVRPNVTNAIMCLVQGRSGSSGGQWRLTQTISGGVSFYATDTNNVQCVLASTALGLISTGAWNTVYVTVDTASSSNCKIYVNGADTSVAWTLVNTNMALNRTHLYLGADDSNGLDLNGSESHFWLHNQTMAPATYHASFFSGLAPVDVGSDGSAPGVTPGAYLKFTAGSLGVNSGSLGGTGSIAGTDVASGPTFP